MGTTLTGTTPQDTYDALIKVGDNGIITGSLKTLSDGEGHDTALALSTGAASVTGTLAVSGNATFDTNTLFVDAAANEVGIGTATPSSPLDVVANNNTAIHLRLRGRASDSVGQMELWNNAQDTRFGFIAADSASVFMSSTQAIPLTFGTNTTERMRLTSDGYLRLTAASAGIQFNGDTADSNSLDDYEEGTWTIGVAFGGASVGVTTSTNTGTYTKIGRQVTVNGYVILTSKGSSTGLARVTGLPFVVGSGNQNFSATSLRFNKISFTNQFQGYGVVNTSTIELEEISTLGVVTAITNTDFANDSEVLLSLTYFV